MSSLAPPAEEPVWLVRHRAAATERLAATAWPRESEEVWRYSGIDGFDPDGFDPGRHRPVDRAEAAPAAVVAADGLGDRAALVVTRAGAASVVEAAGVAGLEVRRLAGADRPDGLGTVATVHDAFGSLHDAHLADGVVVEVAAGTTLGAPVVIVHLVDTATSPTAPVHPLRTVVRLGAGASATVVELAVAAPGAGDGEALVLPVTELDVGGAAHLGYVSLQTLPAGATQVAVQASRVERDATLRAFTAGFGGRYARVRTDSALVGPGASSELLAAYLGTGEQVHDFRTLQDHLAPHTDSELVFTGAVADRARSVYSGLIRIRSGAAKANARQTNRNLVLSEGAHADSVPNLDILENDVRCSHASSVGPIDEDQRYYLEARGVDPEAAERMIVLGFFTDLAQRAPIEAVSRFVDAEVRARLGRRLAGVGAGG